MDTNKQPFGQPGLQLVKTFEGQVPTTITMQAEVLSHPLHVLNFGYRNTEQLSVNFDRECFIG